MPPAGVSAPRPTYFLCGCKERKQRKHLECNTPGSPSLSIAVLLGNPELWQIKAHTAARMVLIEALKSRAGS